MNLPDNRPKSSTLAIVALVFSIICAPIGIVLGVIALIQISNSNGQLGGKTMAIVAIVLPVAMIPVFGILAAIAIPNFIRFQLRAKTSEAKMVLNQLRTNQESFRADNNFYSAVRTNPASDPAPLPAMWEERECNAACSSDQGACLEASCIGYVPPGPVYYRYTCDATKEDFVCVAFGDLDGDGSPGVFITGSGTDTIRLPAPKLAATWCTGRYPAGAVTDCTPGQF
jgi:type IV pilus assembly protein PilA